MIVLSCFEFGLIHFIVQSYVTGRCDNSLKLYDNVTWKAVHNGKGRGLFLTASISLHYLLRVALV